MPHQADAQPTTPVFIAVAACWQNANPSDREPNPGNRTDINREAAMLCRRAADDLETRE